MFGVIVMFVIILTFIVYLTKKTNEGKDILMSLKDVISEVKELVARLVNQPDQSAEIAALTDLLAEERAAAVALAVAEDAEDVEQNNALAAAQAETDAKVAEIAEASAELAEVKTSLSGLVKEDEVEVPETPAEEPAVETPVDEPVVTEPEAPVEEPVAEEPAPAEEPAVDPVLTGEETPEYNGEPDTATDEDGNPVNA